jgi:hypothetical protein
MKTPFASSRRLRTSAQSHKHSRRIVEERRQQEPDRRPGTSIITQMPEPALGRMLDRQYREA